jgi:hypothetical protein
MIEGGPAGWLAVVAAVFALWLLVAAGIEVGRLFARETRTEWLATYVVVLLLLVFAGGTGVVWLIGWGVEEMARGYGW